MGREVGLTGFLRRPSVRSGRERGFMSQMALQHAVQAHTSLGPRRASAIDRRIYMKALP